MYQKGDKIVCPLHGAGEIESLEEREVDGELQTYYILTIPVGNLKLMISASKSKTQNIRSVHDKDDILNILQSSLYMEVDMPDNWNQRYKDNLERIRTGNLAIVGMVYNNLLHRERVKGLSTSEKKMMTTTKQIILSELMLSLGTEKKEAEQILQNTFK